MRYVFPTIHKDENLKKLSWKCALVTIVPSMILQVSRICPSCSSEFMKIIHFLILELDEYVWYAFQSAIENLEFPAFECFSTFFPIILSSFNNCLTIAKVRLLDTFQSFYHKIDQNTEKFADLFDSIAQAINGYLKSETDPSIIEYFLKYLIWYIQNSNC